MFSLDNQEKLQIVFKNTKGNLKFLSEYTGHDDRKFLFLVNSFDVKGTIILADVVLCKNKYSTPLHNMDAARLVMK